ncbi:MAG: NnrU family protein [Cellvibrionaceae bacterium]
MILLVIGLLLFIGIHALPAFVSVRQALIDKLRFNGYRGLFSLVALAGLVLIVIGKATAEFVPLWNPLAWGRHAAMGVVFVAFILLPAAYMPTNIKRFTRHPMLWGVVLWSAGHLLANGDLASVILFGSLGGFSLLSMASANRRGAILQTGRVPVTKDVLVIVAGLAVYGVFLFAHPWLFGVAVR